MFFFLCTDWIPQPAYVDRVDGGRVGGREVYEVVVGRDRVGALGVGENLPHKLLGESREDVCYDCEVEGFVLVSVVVGVAAATTTAAAAAAVSFLPY